MTDHELTRMLSDNGLRSTADRRRILSLFLNDRAWTVAQVHARLGGADLSTAYRNVNTLVEHGLLKTAPVQGKETYYESALKSHHAHRTCRRCGDALCVPCPMEPHGQARGTVGALRDGGAYKAESAAAPIVCSAAYGPTGGAAVLPDQTRGLLRRRMDDSSDEHALQIYAVCADCSGGAR